MASNTGFNQIRSYSIPCASTFRDTDSAPAKIHRVNVGNLARSVLLPVPRDVVAKYPNSSEPIPDNREQVVHKSGPSANKPWWHKPRLQAHFLPRDQDTGDTPRARHGLGEGIGRRRVNARVRQQTKTGR